MVLYIHTHIYYFWKYSLDFQTVMVLKDKIKLQSQKKSIISLVFPNQIEALYLIKPKMSILHAIAILIVLYWEGSRLLYHHIVQSWADVSSHDCFCFPSLSFTFYFDNNLLWHNKVSKGSKIYWVVSFWFSPLITCSEMSFLPSPPPEMHSQLNLISEFLLVLCFFLYFTLHSTKAPFETVFYCSVNL